MITSGKLAAWIADGTVYGVTSNPTIFARHERNGGDYTAILGSAAGKDALASDDLAARHRPRRRSSPAAPRRTGGRWISLEVLPALAQTRGRITEASACRPPDPAERLRRSRRSRSPPIRRLHRRRRLR
jgi:transaldolase